MEYQLKLTKPSSLRGSDHGKIQALTDIYNFIINTPTGDLSPKSIREEIQKSQQLLDGFESDPKKGFKSVVGMLEEKNKAVGELKHKDHPYGEVYEGD